MDTLVEKVELEEIEVRQVCHIVSGHGIGLCGESERCKAFCDCETAKSCPGCGRIVCPDCKARLRSAREA